MNNVSIVGAEVVGDGKIIPGRPRPKGSSVSGYQLKHQRIAEEEIVCALIDRAEEWIADRGR